MKKYTADLNLWRRVNTCLNVPALLQDIFNINHILPGDSTVKLIAENPPEIAKQNSRGNALALLSKTVDMDTFLNVIYKAHTVKDDNIFVFDRFDDDEEETLSFPLMGQKIMDLIPTYCDKFYEGKYDFRLTSDEGFHNIDLILKIEGDNWKRVMEDVSFMVLKDGDIVNLYNYKIENMIPFEEYVDDGILQGEL